MTLFISLFVYINKQIQSKRKLEIENQHKEQINSCIKVAQIERDRRKSNINSVENTCLSDYGLLTFKDCDSLAEEGKSSVDKMYSEWESNCERGINNNF